mmetsp:Transcript_8069/g.20686  ORF Transcript_8069/g.20686 Transcript_8069/m.20686 type:complete len:263 (-) Transcript_8069:194-982(-)
MHRCLGLANAAFAAVAGGNLRAAAAQLVTAQEAQLPAQHVRVGRLQVRRLRIRWAVVHHQPQRRVAPESGQVHVLHHGQVAQLPAGQVDVHGVDGEGVGGVEVDGRREGALDTCRPVARLLLQRHAQRWQRAAARRHHHFVHVAPQREHDMRQLPARAGVAEGVVHEAVKAAHKAEQDAAQAARDKAQLHALRNLRAEVQPAGGLPLELSLHLYLEPPLAARKHTLVVKWVRIRPARRPHQHQRVPLEERRFDRYRLASIYH